MAESCAIAGSFQNGRARREHSRHSPEIPARETAFHEFILLLPIETNRHGYTSPVMQVLLLLVADWWSGNGNFTFDPSSPGSVLCLTPAPLETRSERRALWR
jgi:hypothetical protein